MIFKFSTTATTELTNFYEWLVDHKADTFLNNVDISLDENIINFVKNGVSISFTATILGSTTKTAVSYVGDYINFEWKNSGATSSFLRIVSAAICNNGLIIRFETKKSASIVTRSLSITKDDNNDLCIVVYNGNIDASNANEFSIGAYVKDSFSENYCTVQPTFSNGLTALSSLIANSNTNVIMPNFYIATATQVENIGLYTANFNGDLYITDGYYFIKD